jgi:hypothetical protein
MPDAPPLKALTGMLLLPFIVGVTLQLRALRRLQTAAP